MTLAEGVMRRLKLRRRLRQRVINEGLMGKQRSLKRGKMSTKAEVKVETEAEKVAASTTEIEIKRKRGQINAKVAGRRGSVSQRLRRSRSEAAHQSPQQQQQQ